MSEESKKTVEKLLSGLESLDLGEVSPKEEVQDLAEKHGMKVLDLNRNELELIVSSLHEDIDACSRTLKAAEEAEDTVLGVQACLRGIQAAKLYRKLSNLLSSRSESLQ